MERIIGLDGEMSGADFHSGHRLIQIGVALDTDKNGDRLDVPLVFESLIGWPEDQLIWSPSAEAVHRIPIEEVLSAPPAYEVDAALTDWLWVNGITPKNRRFHVLTGFNVGRFDSIFLERDLPHSFKYFSRRYADLNPFLFAFASSLGQYSGTPRNSSQWKDVLNNAGHDLLSQTSHNKPEHNAATDAILALGAWRKIETILSQLDSSHS